MKTSDLCTDNGELWTINDELWGIVKKRIRGHGTIFCPRSGEPAFQMLVDDENNELVFHNYKILGKQYSNSLDEVMDLILADSMPYV